MPNKIIEEGWPDRFYISLETEEETATFKSKAEQVVLIETLGSLSPILVVRFRDFLGSIISSSSVYPSGVYTLNIGRNIEEAEALDFSISKNQFENLSKSKAENLICSLYFITDHWPQTFKTKHNRGWEEKQYSDVVQEIASEIGYDEVDVEPTEGLYNIIQPYWTNSQMIEWLSQQSISGEGHIGYEFTATLDDRFIFKSFNKLLEEEPKKEIVIASVPNYEKGSETLVASDIQIEQNYAEIMKEGAGGYTYSFFDWNNKEYKKKEKTVSDTDQTQLSDWYYIAEDHEDAGNFIYKSRNVDADVNIENRLAHLSNSIQTVTVTVQGDITLHVGDIVNLIVPNTYFHDDVFNEFYSGYYMISKVEHTIQLINNDRRFDTKLELTRQGVDDGDDGLEGFVESQAGKQLG